MSICQHIPTDLALKLNLKSEADRREIACVRLVDGRVVNFVHDAVAERQPEPAARLISGAESFFGDRRPLWEATKAPWPDCCSRWHRMCSLDQILLLYPFTLSNASCVESTTEPEKEQNEDIQDYKGGHDQQRNSVDNLFDCVILCSW